MASNRHLGRIVALQSLYELDFREQSDPETAPNINAILERNLTVYSQSIEDTKFVEELTHGVVDKMDEIDKLIAPAAPDWPIDQIAKIDRAILRLAVYELMIGRDVPPKVVINEAVELAKAFGGENSSKFVNGVLGTIYRKSEFYEPEEDNKAKAEEKQPKPEPES